MLAIRLIVVLGMSCLFALAAWAQPPATNMTSKNPEIDIRDSPTKRKTVLFLVRSNTSKTMYGNPCVQEVTRKMGFEYLVVPKGQALNRNGFSRTMHNGAVSLALFFRNGPLWKLRARHKIKKCRQKSADFMG
ncbi:hypothetical protein QWY31_13760 [Cytophagales bacterium LB-30]|uniref:Uncharacterized protein n=1 Tax=Shiella aurantiaca TaxID=3058365 RepID=A0ABT8F7X9_9BACT|nr:hypothetical protein [Shiella aurantiaca]MDN4166570.1 hypothetical protein [Shiella aurantiaca]